eukprot:COSAG01_NODE_37838_length_498_cov_0.819549_2_plen_51_part_01
MELLMLLWLLPWLRQWRGRRQAPSRVWRGVVMEGARCGVLVRSFPYVSSQL